ncbi:MAG: amidohydrolase family protein [Syntrophales bacterium]|nr:amidohydrolase family protein [Syntrophales bacterium]
MKIHETTKSGENRMIGRFLSFQRGLLVFACLIFLICGPQAAFSTSEQSYDVLIKGGTIYDGTLKPPYVADIAIKNDKIAAIGILSGEASKTLDASGFIVTPGFIDIHEHSDMIFAGGITGDSSDVREELKGNYNALFQGVATVVTGNCGNAISDTTKWLGMVESMNFGTNVMHLVPHGKIRFEIFGKNQPEEMSPAQLDLMKARVESEMKKGAGGMSTGLAYAPGIKATTEELIELSKVVNRYGGIYATHMRDETGTILEDGRIALLESIKEAIEIGRRSGIPVQISHLKLQAPHNGVKASRILGLIEEARREGLDVTTDSYTYTAGVSELAILLPNRFKTAAGGISEQYKTRDGRKQIKGVIEKVFIDIPPEKFKIIGYEGKSEYEGKTLKEISAIEGKDPIDCYVDLVCGKNMPIGIIFAHNEQAMRDFMPNHYVFTCSDGMTWARGLEGAHPRFYGAFARKLRQFTLDEHLLSLPDAIRSMTYLPAEKLGMAGRGKIEQGAFADIAILDLNTLTDKSTYEKPDTYAEGIVHLLVNGVVTIENRKLTGRRGGRALKGRGKTKNK